MTRPKLSRKFILDTRARRIEVACAEAAILKGSIHDVIVADIVSQAGIARNTFYELFEGKPNCARSAVGTAFDEAIAAAEGGGIPALLSWVEANPALARLVLLEGFALPEMENVYQRGMWRFSALLCDQHPGQEISEMHEMVVGGVSAILAQRVRHNALGIGDLAPELERFVAAPFEVCR